MADRLRNARAGFEGAEKLIRDTLDTRRRIRGEDDPRTLEARHALAYLQAIQGRTREAEAALRSVWAARERILGGSHAETLETLERLAEVVRPRDPLEAEKHLAAQEAQREAAE